ncbi:hypothetical protein CANCADRAFT_24132 [Tortispora caseinolytica NRRL Y-17796]|uniref:Carbon catabolite-derepressing protein kinase n=1 Tax=Tortispora caseinolytica NRRL Y-17796 TaxID=767744 RepID=A0A1E4TF32_9ASCO|nr:hypothetical protein CANCADRAFT_24132 [Tortispora caseinolytica NRRL Y-17796]
MEQPPPHITTKPPAEKREAPPHTSAPDLSATINAAPPKSKQTPVSSDSFLSNSSADRIGRYHIIKTLGEGSFGKVKLAYNVSNGQRVALKIINRKTLAKSDMQGRVEREISYLRLLRHPHIIKLYEVMKSQDQIVMVIEFAGRELFDYIVQKGRMSEGEARRFFQQIISAVEYCHRHKIVHRDLKPENLLLNDQLNVKIADFGLSNIMTDGNFLKTSCGSPNYAAPEVISGKLYAGPEVDVWSCGVILYVMLCGRLPFDDEFIPNLFKKISGGVYAIPSYVTPGAKSLLQRMLVVDPLNRITVHEIMQDPWFRVDLPEYLLPPEEREQIAKDNNDEIDDAAVRALARTMGYDVEDVYEALRKNPTEDSEICDAYSLMKENPPTQTPRSSDTQKSEQGYAPRVSFQSNLRPAPPTLTFSKSHLHPGIETAGLRTPSTTVAILPSSLPAFHRANMMAYFPQISERIQPTSSRKSKARWHFGIRSRSYPLDVMGEIYRALKCLGAEWATPDKNDPWTIYVRWRYLPAGVKGIKATELKFEQGYLLKMQIQLYQQEPNNYLVDFKFDGWDKPDLPSLAEKAAKNEAEYQYSTYPFLHLATRLIVELAVNSQG